MSDRLKQIEARVNAASPGPWRVGYGIFRCTLEHFPHGKEGCEYRFDSWVTNEHRVSVDCESERVDICSNYDYDEGGVVHENDAPLIAHARADIPWLLAQLRAAEEEITKAIDLMCKLCGDGIPVERGVVEAGPTEIVFWRHKEDGKIVADCTQDAADIHERRYQRQRAAPAVAEIEL